MGESFALLTKIRDLVEAAQSVGHLQQQVCREYLLEARVDPDGMPVVGEALGPPDLPRRSLREPRLVIHSGAKAGRPVGAVAPGAVASQPPVVGDENGEDPPEAIAVSSDAVVLPLRPRHYVGSRARRIEALEAVFPVEGADLTADKPVGVLAGIEILQGALEVEGAATVAGEKQDECRAPHEQAVVEGRVDKACDESAPRFGTAQVGERQPPRPTVAFYGTLVTLPERLGQGVPRVLERGRWDVFRRHPHEGVLLDQRFPEMGVDVAVARSQLADLLMADPASRILYTHKPWVSLRPRKSTDFWLHFDLVPHAYSTSASFSIRIPRGHSPLRPLDRPVGGEDFMPWMVHGTGILRDNVPIM